MKQDTGKLKIQKTAVPAMVKYLWGKALSKGEKHTKGIMNLH